MNDLEIILHQFRAATKLFHKSKYGSKHGPAKFPLQLLEFPLHAEFHCHETGALVEVEHFAQTLQASVG